MSVFISWAEKESLSHNGALLLQKWLPEVLHNLESFVSSEDIASGTLWLQKLFDQLEVSESGVLCLTKESLDRNWILFEAGALAKRAGKETGRVCPLLFEFKTLSFPLAAFQAHSLDKNDETRSKKEMFLLVKTLNKNRPSSLFLDETQLERQFNRCWGEFWNPYVDLCNNHARTNTPHAVTAISNEDILAEMRGAIRQIADALTEIRRQAVMVSDEKSADFQQFNVQCPFCQVGNEVLMPDRPGETKPTICSACGARFNVHMTGAHSVFVRPISSIPTVSTHHQLLTETVHCPTCQGALTVELPDRIGETRSPLCPNCRKTVNVHRTGGLGVATRMGDNTSIGAPVGTDEGPNRSWLRFLKETQVWIVPATLPALVLMTETVSIEHTAEEELTPDGLCKKMFLRIDATTSPALSKTMVRTFIKIIFFGGALHFPAAVGNATWRTPFSNTLTQTDLIQAYARGIARRLTSRFVFASGDFPELLKLLFPPEMTGVEDALREALAECEKKCEKTT